ncbi:MAG: hypothetical protein M1274_03930 [Actinobacteria bacterium]|nr:hypothetical protein [Actinomycetota bacterium]
MSRQSDPRGNWFTETVLPFAEPDVEIAFRITQTLCDEKSDFARIQIFDTPFLGRVLAIDGIINIARETEFIYHEMMVSLPAVYHGHPETVLVIGGGDGSAVKHALRVKSVERVVMVEVDSLVTQLCQLHIPELADGALEDERVAVRFADGIDYVKATTEKFDLVVLDVSDPIPGGPAENLLTPEFLRDVKKCLKHQGVVATHCGSLIFQAAKVRHVLKHLRDLFGHVTMHIALVPEFELTEFGFLVCSDADGPTISQVDDRFRELFSNDLLFLSPDFFQSSKVLSPYMTRLTGANRQ